MTDQPTTNSLYHAINMWAGTGEQTHLLSALEEAMRLIANLQARVAEMESQASDTPEFDLLEHDSAGLGDEWGGLARS